MFIPVQVVMVSNYLLISGWGLLNSYTGVVLPQLANGFGVFLLRQHLRVFPQARRGRIGLGPPHGGRDPRRAAGADPLRARPAAGAAIVGGRGNQGLNTETT